MLAKIIEVANDLLVDAFYSITYLRQGDTHSFVRGVCAIFIVSFFATLLMSLALLWLPP